MADPNITVTEQIVREAPDIEAYKLGLLEAGKTLANIPIRLPEQQVIGADPLEASVYDYLGGMGTAGIGGYAPLATTGYGTIGTGLGTLGTAQDLFGTGVSRIDEATAALAPAYGALAGGSGEFDPTTVSQYMDPYEEAVVQAALADIQREGDIAQRTLDAGAVGAGAFGGSRQGSERAEIVRNVLDRQAKTAAQLRSAGYQSALTQAQNAFEQARQRQLAQAGAYTGLAGQQTAMGQGIAGIGGQVQVSGFSRPVSDSSNWGRPNKRNVSSCRTCPVCSSLDNRGGVLRKPWPTRLRKTGEGSCMSLTLVSVTCPTFTRAHLLQKAQ